MKHLHKTLASKILICSLSLFLMLATSSLAQGHDSRTGGNGVQELDRSTGEQGVNPAVDVSVHPEVTGQPADQPSNSRTAKPASTFGATRPKPLSATTGSRTAPKAQTPLQPFNSANQGSSSDTQLNATTGVTQPPSAQQKHVAHSAGAGNAPTPAPHLGFAATQPQLGGLQSSVHHSSGKHSAHNSSNKLFTSKHKSLNQGIARESKSGAAHSPKSRLDK
jgi:hypothetical protein